jgi:hypothetical protein
MAFSFCRDDSAQPQAEPATKSPGPLKAFAIRHQDAVSLQINLSDLLAFREKMISMIIFVDNLFRIDYVSVTRNSCGHKLAEFGAICT